MPTEAVAFDADTVVDITTVATLEDGTDYFLTNIGEGNLYIAEGDTPPELHTANGHPVAKFSELSGTLGEFYFTKNSGVDIFVWSPHEAGRIVVSET